jgi:hypothetical protein
MFIKCTSRSRISSYASYSMLRHENEAVMSWALVMMKGLVIAKLGILGRQRQFHWHPKFANAAPQHRERLYCHPTGDDNSSCMTVSVKGHSEFRLMCWVFDFADFIKSINLHVMRITMIS